MHLLRGKGWSLRYSPRWGNPLLYIVVLYVGEGSDREQCQLLSSHPIFKRLAVSPAMTTHTGFYSQRFRGLILPLLESWVTQSVSLSSCSSQFIHMRMWDHPVCQLPPGSPVLSTPAAHLLHSYQSEWMFLLYLLGCQASTQFDFSGSSGSFLFLNWLFPSFSCVRRWSVSTYASILAGTPVFNIFNLFFIGDYFSSL